MHIYIEKPKKSLCHRNLKFYDIILPKSKNKGKQFKRMWQNSYFEGQEWKKQ